MVYRFRLKGFWVTRFVIIQTFMAMFVFGLPLGPERKPEKIENPYGPTPWAHSQQSHLVLLRPPRMDKSKAPRVLGSWFGLDGSGFSVTGLRAFRI